MELKLEEQAYTVSPTGTVEPVNPKNGTDFQLSELKKIVGGYIEVVRLDDNMIMVVDEEGKLKRYDINPLATDLARKYNAIAKGDFIVGKILVCRNDQVR